MTVDVVTEIVVGRPRDVVAAYAVNPDNAPEWYENIRSIEWRSPTPLQVGSQFEFVAQFLGRRLAYTYQVREFVPGERLVMSTAEGPFPMETTYKFQDAGPDATRMALGNRGEPSGFTVVMGPLMASGMRRANRKDLRRIKSILEASALVPDRAETAQ